jgi:hypothetical protein
MLRILRTFCAAVTFFVIATGMGAARVSKTEVMIVGVSHLVSKRDIHKSVYTDSPLSPARQTQVDEIVARLARFHPTKVLIEATFGDPKYPEQYREYLAGRFTLGANEIYQYGFKLAARAGNDTIYPIDTYGPAVYDESTPDGKRIDAFLMKHFNDVNDPEMDAYVARDNYLQLHGTYLDELLYLNTDGAIQANASWYSIFVGMGREAGNAGAAYVAQWYTRNCYIFSNILSVARPGDRVVVFIGLGHKYLLREFVRLNPNMTYVDALRYLSP